MRGYSIVSFIVVMVIAAVAFSAAPGTAQTAAKKKRASTVERSCPQGRVSVAKFETEKGVTLPLAINKALTRKPGDVDRGLQIAADPLRGRCLDCHQIAKVTALVENDNPESEARFGSHGEVGSPLNGIGDRFTEGELRLTLVDPEQAFPDADIAMPPYHRATDLLDVHPHCKGRPILTAQEIEDVVAFLKTLK